MYNPHHNKHAVILMLVIGFLCLSVYSCSAEENSQICVTTLTEDGPVEVCEPLDYKQPEAL